MSLRMAYRDTSLIKNCLIVGPFSRPMPRALYRPQGGGAVSCGRGTPVTYGPLDNPRMGLEKESNHNLSGNEVYFTACYFLVILKYRVVDIIARKVFISLSFHIRSAVAAAVARLGTQKDSYDRNPAIPLAVFRRKPFRYSHIDFGAKKKPGLLSHGGRSNCRYSNLHSICPHRCRATRNTTRQS